MIVIPTYDASRLSIVDEPRRPGEAAPTTSRWRRAKSNTNLRDSPPVSTTAVPSYATLRPPARADREPSRMSLFSLFSKPKVEKARGHTEAGLDLPPAPQPRRRDPSPPKSSLRHNPSPDAQQAQWMRSKPASRPVSMRISPQGRASGEDDDWDPPPLFQAYPQAVKYATVQACAHSADVLLKSQGQRQQAELVREQLAQQHDLSAGQESSAEQKKLEKSQKRLTTHLAAMTAPHMTDKIFMLVTSGYVLQYASDGMFDRLPEKVLKLGPESAAFACDLIPGKHWVLQISSSADEDGAVAPAPKHSLLSRLRLHHSHIRKSATSLLLVMDSAAEMKDWMTIVRKEIEALGGMKASHEPEPSRPPSMVGSPDRSNARATSARAVPQRESQRMSKATSRPVDSPLQSQYSESPRITAFEWESEHCEPKKTADTLNVESSHSSTARQSADVSSVASTVLTLDHGLLEHLRDRPRLSYMSTASTLSGTGTKDTSHNSSPSGSPVDEQGLSTAADTLRSATSLKSFHMNPGNSTARRRSVQPLPVTNEHAMPSASVKAPQQRQLIPTPHEPAVDKKAEAEGANPAAVATTDAGSTRPSRTINTPRQSITVQQQMSKPARHSNRVSSAPQTRFPVISPPPRDAAPTPPAARPLSIIGNMPPAPAASNHAQRRVSSNPKPFMRPLPVRTQSQNQDESVVIPRRLSSLAGARPAPLPLGIVVNRSSTAPLRPASTSPRQNARGNAFASGAAAQPLRRPTSVQVRTSPAPFLLSARPTRTTSSTPSSITEKRISTAPTVAALHPSPSSSVLRGQGQQLSPPKPLAPRRSVPAIALPPPAPPPTMPLPKPPTEMPLPKPPPEMPLPPPPPPPTIPLPALPL